MNDSLVWLWGPATFDGAAWLALLGHFAVLSLLAIGGAMVTAPGMHRFVVDQTGWLSDGQFTASVALAQAAPGPNVLVVAVLGYNVGGLAGVIATMAGILLPSSTLTFVVSRYGAREHAAPALRAITTGLAPLTIGLLGSTGWILLDPTRTRADTWLLVALTLLLMLRTRLSPLWPICIGAIAGIAGWV
ncbi:MAG: chromate transporter [Pseudomonadota bacterium]|nr:chromate transporter [Pseudomonadota bacterium]